MKQFTRRVRRYGRAFFNVKTLVVGSGLLVSVIAHELFHVLMHWGRVTSIELFPNHQAIVVITSHTQLGYNAQLEEAIAYGITMAVMIITVAIVCLLHDKKDTRTFTDIVFPRDKTFQQMSPDELYELAARIKLV